MDLLIQKTDKKKPFIETFFKSKIVVKILQDLTKETGLNVVVVDGKGGMIIPGPENSVEEEEELLNLVDSEYPNGKEIKILKTAEDGPRGFVLKPLKKAGSDNPFAHVLAGPIVHPAVSDGLDISGPTGEKINGRIDMDRQKIMIDNELDSLKQNLRSACHYIELIYEEKNRDRRNLERLNNLYRINSSLLGVLDLSNILHLLMEEAVKLLEADSGTVMLLIPGKNQLQLIASVGINAEEVTIFVDADVEVIQKTIRSKKPYQVKGRELQELVDFLPGVSKPNSGLLVPIRSNKKIVGVMSFIKKEGSDTFDNEDLELMSVLVSNTATAIDNAALYHQLQRKVLEFGALFDLSSTIVSTLDRKEVLTKVLDNAIELLHAGAGSLMLRDFEKDILEIEVAHGLPSQVIKETKIPLGVGISGKVAKEGKPRLLQKGIKVAGSTKSEKAAKEEPSAMSVPMKFHSKIIGVINVKEKSDGGNFTNDDMELLKMLANQAAIAIENARLHKSLEDLFVNSIKALANAIEARDPYTRGHSERVTEYSVKIACTMGMDSETLKKLRYAALLHDIGKINIKEEILNKPGKLTDEEFRIMNRHPTLGAKIMEPVKEFRDILPIMYHHHERYGAGGYPDGVSGDEIPLPARILAVADSFDAMTSDRPYRKALPLEIAVAELKKHSGTQFDPSVVTVFLKILETQPEWLSSVIGSTTEELSD